MIGKGVALLNNYLFFLSLYRAKFLSLDVKGLLAQLWIISISPLLLDIFGTPNSWISSFPFLLKLHYESCKF